MADPETALEGVRAAATEAQPPEPAPEAQPETATPEAEASPQAETKPEAEPEAETKPEAQPEPDDTPISDWSKVKLDLPKDAEIDQDLLASFGSEIAVKLGLTPRQSNAIINFQLQAIADYKAAQNKANTAELKRLWGRDELANKQKVINLLYRVNGIEGCEGFDAALGASGGADNPTVLNGLLAIANLLDEDGTGAGGQAQVVQEEDALAGIRAALAESRRQ